MSNDHEFAVNSFVWVSIVYSRCLQMDVRGYCGSNELKQRRTLVEKCGRPRSFLMKVERE